MSLSTNRRLLTTLALVGLLVAAAGCAGLGGSQSATTTAATTTNGTTEATTTTTTSTTTTSTTAAATNTVANGQITVLIGGKQVPLADAKGPVSFDDSVRTWSASKRGVTIAKALAEAGVNVTASTLSYDGTTYDGSANGTTVAVRVNGKAVDPTTTKLSGGDSVWVYVSSPNATVTPPGTYIPENRDHEHGTISISVNGSKLDLSQQRFQSQSKYFHLESGNGVEWHAHSWSVTLGWGLKTLGFDVKNDTTVTYNGTTYRNGDSGTTVQVLVNGKQVDPSTYRLKDGDTIKVVLNKS